MLQRRLTPFLCAAVAALALSPSVLGNPPAPASAVHHARQRHLAALGVERWHSAGYRGKGLKIAVLDTGWRGYKSRLGGALPANVTARSFRQDGNMEAKDSEHGILCAEVLHALAPDAELLLADWDWGRAEQFLGAVRWAKEQGAKVISCSVVNPSWSDGEGGGLVSRELSRVLGQGAGKEDVLCFASAGNTTKRHWVGPFRDGGNGIHQWQAGVLDNGLTPLKGEPVMVELYAPPGPNYGLHVWDTATGQEVAHARTHSRLEDRSSAAVRFPPQPGHAYAVRVRLLDGQPGSFHLTTTFGTLGCTVAKSNVCFPADNAYVIAVGAADLTGARQSYSACGPNSPLPKPDFVAPVPFVSTWRAKHFGGTSAAAPQGAALAALLWSRHPGWTAEQVRTALRSSALDVGAPRHDWETGFGLLRLPTE